MKSGLKLFASVVVVCGAAFAGAADKVSKVSLSVPSVAGGTTSAGTVELTAKAGSTGAVVALTSSNAAVTVPATVTVASGQTTVNFTATTSPVAANLSAVIKATLGTSSATTTLGVEAPKVAEFSFIPPSVVGGSGATATVKLSSAAPAEGTKVSLSASSAAWGGPTSVVIPAGATSATLAFTSIPVSELTNSDVTASVPGSKVGATLTVEAPHIASFVLSSSSVIGGVHPSGTLTLNGAAPKGGFKIKMTSGASSAIVPSTIEIAAGATSTSVGIVTKAVSNKAAARINVVAPGASVELLLTINPPSLTALNLASTSMSAGQSTTATVTLNGIAPEGGFKIALTSNQAGVQVPKSVTIAAGSTAATFAVTSTAASNGTTASIGATDPNGKALLTALAIGTVSTTSKNPPPHKPSH